MESLCFNLVTKRAGLNKNKYRSYNSPYPPSPIRKDGRNWDWRLGDIVSCSLQTPVMSGKVRLVGPVDRGLSEWPEKSDLGNNPAFWSDRISLLSANITLDWPGVIVTNEKVDLLKPKVDWSFPSVDILRK